MTMYLLLLKYTSRSGPYNDWMMFSSASDATTTLERERKKTEQYGMMAGVMAPGLVDGRIVVVEALP